MKRGGFTFIELIAVIVIIAILAVAALPKYNSLSNQAKVNMELSTFKSLIPALEWADSAYKDIIITGWKGGKDGNRSTFDIDGDGNEENYVAGKLVTLHGTIEESRFDSTSFSDISKRYAVLNDNAKIFSKIAKDTQGLRVAAYVNGSEEGIDVTGNGSESTEFDILLLTGQASSRLSGVQEDTVNQDIISRPDDNDIWIYNGSLFPVDMQASSAGVIISQNSTYIKPGDLVLIDIDGSQPRDSIKLQNFSIVRSDSTGSAVNFRALSQDGY